MSKVISYRLLYKLINVSNTQRLRIVSVAISVGLCQGTDRRFRYCQWWNIQGYEIKMQAVQFQ